MFIGLRGSNGLPAWCGSKGVETGSYNRVMGFKPRSTSRTAVIYWVLPKGCQSIAEADMQMSLFFGSISLTLYCLTPAHAEQRADIARLFAQAEQEARVGIARKTKPVDVRPARIGEVVVTNIAGEGKETQSPPARDGDMVVRNRCPETGNEEILVTAAKFQERYEGPAGSADTDGWRAYNPRGVEMLYFIVRNVDGSFTFDAPWGEPMIARPNDAIVRNPNDPKDTYRIAAAAFDCTYEIVRSAQ